MKTIKIILTQWLIPTPVDALFFLIFLFASNPITSYDFFWHLSMGREISSHKDIQHFDVYHQNHDKKEWRNYSWLSDYIFFELYKKWNFRFLIFLNAFFITVTYIVFFKRLKRSNISYIFSFFLLIIVSLASIQFWSLRPVIISTLFASLFMLVLGKNSGFKTWIIVPIQWLWVNIHAGFVMGYLVLTWSMLRDILHSQKMPMKYKLKETSLIPCMTAILITIFNPYGIHALLEPFEVLKNFHLLSELTEWQSPNISENIWGILAILLSFLLLLLNRKNISAENFLFTLIFLVIALGAKRNVEIYLLLTFPLISKNIKLKMNNWNRAKVYSEYSWRFSKNFLIVLLIFSYSLFANGYVKCAVNQKIFPVAAVEYIKREKLSKEIFSWCGWGGYLLWELYPDYRISFDGRGYFNSENIKEYRQIALVTTNIEKILKNMEINTVLWKSNEPLSVYLHGNENWVLLMKDDDAVLFKRK